MSKFDDVYSKCEKQLKDQGVEPNAELLTSIAKSLGPSIYNQDSLMVAASDKTEIDGIKQKFLVTKLGCNNDASLDKALETAVDKIGKSNRQKLRPAFYYLLVKELGKESVFSA